MISKQAVEEQLKRIGCNFKFWGRAEVNELGRILFEDEIIAECTNGEYANGFALLVATNHRILLVDKKPMLYLTVEDVRFEMITEFNYSHRMLNATIRLYTANKTLVFTSWNHRRLRRLLEYSQQRVLEMRQQQHMAQQFQAAAAAQYAQLHAANHYQFTGQVQPGPIANTDLTPQLEAGQPQLQQPMLQQSPSHQQPLHIPASEISAASLLHRQQLQQLPPPVHQNHTQSVDNFVPELAPLSLRERHINMGAMASRFAAKRTALGTYTRSKLPSFHRHQDRQDQRQDQPNVQAESGELYPRGYAAGRPVTDYGLPYRY